MWWVAVFSIIQISSWMARADLLMSVGERKKIVAHGELIIGPEKVLLAKDLGSHFQIEALKAGWTLIRNGNESVEVSVLKQEQFETLRLLQKEIQKTLGLKAVVERGQVVLSGKLLSFSDWERISKACGIRKCNYQSRFQVPSTLRRSLQKSLAVKLQDIGYGNFPIRWEPEIQMGVPGKEKISEQLEKALSSYGIDVFTDPTPIEIAPSIRVQITILEVKKSETAKYGLQWPESYTAQLIPKAQNLDQLFLTARFLETNGLGRVLANPSLLCRSGKESEFLAGGEIPIKIMNYKSKDVVWKKYGILLKMKPLADFSGRMSLSIETEISSIDPAHTADGIPGFLTNRVQSHFDLTESRTIVLSGLIKKQESEASSGLLKFSSIPVLGPLFSSRDFMEDRTELVILVRPELVSPQEGL